MKSYFYTRIVTRFQDLVAHTVNNLFLFFSGQLRNFKSKTHLFDFSNRRKSWKKLINPLQNTPVDYLSLTLYLIYMKFSKNFHRPNHTFSTIQKRITIFSVSK